jgi:hypothetical protein
MAAVREALLRLAVAADAGGEDRGRRRARLPVSNLWRQVQIVGATDAVLGATLLAALIATRGRAAAGEPGPLRLLPWAWLAGVPVLYAARGVPVLSRYLLPLLAGAGVARVARRRALVAGAMLPTRRAAAARLGSRRRSRPQRSRRTSRSMPPRWCRTCARSPPGSRARWWSGVAGSARTRRGTRRSRRPTSARSGTTAGCAWWTSRGSSRRR